MPRGSTPRAPQGPAASESERITGSHGDEHSNSPFLVENPLCDKLIQAKDMQEAARIQSEFFQEQMRSLTDHARSMGESAMKAATGAFTPKR